MANPLFQQLGGNSNMLGSFGQLAQQYKQFRQSFKGDPQQEVQKLLQSGKINQQQLDMVQGLAQQFGQFFE